jgi:hypothetical protein
MSTEDYNVVRTLVNQFYDITDMMLIEIRDGSICGNDMDRYTEQIEAICNAIETIYKVKGGYADV